MATYKHLRSSTANKRPTTSIADGQLAINTNTASPGLFFKDSAGTGIVKVGPVHVGTTAPNVSPAAGGSSGNYTGEQWLDTSVSPNQMKVWNGSAWVGIVADELPVSKLQDGTAGQIVQTDSAGTGVEWSSTTNLPIGSEGAPAYSFQGDPNTGIYSPGADQVAISTGGTQSLIIRSDGLLSVGKTTGDAAIEVGFGATANRSAYMDFVGDTTYTDYGLRIIRGNTGANTDTFIVHRGTGNFNIATQDAAALVFLTANQTRLNITSDGRLLVGTSSAITTFGVTSNLQLAGGTYDAAGLSAQRYAANANGALIGFTKSRNATVGQHTIVNDSDEVGTLRFAASDGTNFIQAVSITAFVDGTPGANDMPGRLVFATTADGASTPTERMTIKSDGKVGIGTSSPVEALDVAGSVRVGAPTGDAAIEIGANATANRNAYIDLVGDTTYTDFGLRIIRGNTGANADSYIVTRGTGALNIATQDAGLLIFQTASQERLRIDSSGRLLVGTQTNTGGALLQINDNRIRIATAKTPASATDTGSAGEICWDASYIYVCTATNTWKRTAIATW